MSPWWLLPLVLVCSSALTAWMRRYALARDLLDRPTARSSHSVPTPRGGGVAIVLCFLGILPLVAAGGNVDAAVLWSLICGGGLVAAIGFADDHGHIAARWRLLAHFAAAACVLAWLGGMPPITVAGWVLAPGWGAGVFGAFYLVWMLNLYNFMDGIDGLAGVEAICICAGGALLYVVLGQTQLALLPLLLAAAVAGFLQWNLPPARIFMGDAGSGFLGLVIGALSIHAAAQAPGLFWAWVILAGVFVVDATFTLLRRLARGEKVYQAHRSHAYQRAALKCGGHLPVTLAVGAINLLWLLPIACWVAVGGVDGALATVLAYLPLLAIDIWLGAGVPER